MKMTSDEEFEEMKINLVKTVYKDKNGRNPNDQEIEEGKIEMTKLTHLVDLFAEEYFDLMDWEARLEQEPKGFPVDVEFKPCPICGCFTTEQNSWFDKNGLKCLTCQTAIKKRVIPAGVCKDRIKWFSEQDLKNNFQLSTIECNKLLKQGKIKPRNIMTLDGKSLYFRVFIERENREFVHEYFIKVIKKGEMQKRKSKA